MTSSRSTLRSSLVKVKQPRPDRKKKGVVYEVPCKDCPSVYIGETGRTLEKQISEHKTAVKKSDPKVVLQCTPGPTSTRSTGKPPPVKQEEGGYWKRRVLESCTSTSNPKPHCRTQAADVQQPCCLLQGQRVQNHPCHCGGWVRTVPPQTEPQQPLFPSEGAPQGQVGSGKGDDPHCSLRFLLHLVLLQQHGCSLTTALCLLYCTLHIYYYFCSY